MKSCPIGIKIITCGNFPYGAASANYLRNLATGLSRFNDVEVLLPNGYSFGNVENKYRSRLGKLGEVTWRYLGFIDSPRKMPVRLLAHIWGLINLSIYVVDARIKGKVDVVIKYGIELSSNILLILLCKWLCLKLVNILPEFYSKPAKFGPSVLRWYDFYWGLRFLGRYSDGMIVLSTYLQNYIRKHGYSNSVIVVPNLVDPTMFEVNAGPGRRNKVTIGYSGTPTHKDGIDDLLCSFALIVRDCPNAHLLVIGDTFKDSPIPRLMREAKDFMIHNNITFAGLVDYEEMPKLLNTCDIFVLARPKGVSSEAGFPTKLGEYMACKKPVVVTSVGDLRYYFQNKDYVVLVEPGNITSIAAGIKSVIRDDAKRNEIGNKGYEWMLQNLEYKKVSKRVHLFINGLVSSTMSYRSIKTATMK